VEPGEACPHSNDWLQTLVTGEQPGEQLSTAVVLFSKTSFKQLPSFKSACDLGKPETEHTAVIDMPEQKSETTIRIA